MEIEAIYTQKGKKHYGILRTYGGEIEFWGIRTKGNSPPTFITKKIFTNDNTNIVIKDPNKIIVNYRQGASDKFELIPAKLNDSQRAFLAKNMRQTIVQTRELSHGEISNILDRIQGFLSQKPETARLITRETDTTENEVRDKLYIGAIVAAIAFLVLVFGAAGWLIINKL